MQQARSRFSTEQIIFVGAALVLIIGIQLPVAHYLSPKSGLGYAIGIVGGTLILAQLLYAVRKRVRSLRWLGSVPGWFQTHMMMGIIGPVCILIHCGFSLGATNSNIALFSMLTVAGSGIFGRYFYSKIHHGLYGRKASLSELQERASELQERSTKLLMMPEASLVHIVTGMTRTADHRGFDYVLRTDMTIGTTDFRVSPEQREAGMGCVVKVPHLPAVRVVALRAVLPQTAVVNIVLGMATGTFLRRVIESLRRVALAAGYDHV